MWHKHANTDHIGKAICDFNWEKSFANKDVNEMVNLFNETICNVLNNYILHATIVCDEQDPPWMNNKVKIAIKRKFSFLAELSQILIMVLFCFSASKINFI